MSAPRPPRAHRRRFENLNNSRFLTFSCFHRLPLLGKPTIRDAFALALSAAHQKYNFALFGWVAMPEHVHLLLMPALPEHPVPELLSGLKRPFGMQVIARWRQLRAPILDRLIDSRGLTRYWQRGGGHDHNIRSREDFYEKLNYIHMNPVRRGLVTSPSAWLWSSARWYEGDRTGPVQLDPHRW